MGVPFTKPARYVPHRWLSVYECALTTERMLPALQVLHYGLMKKEDRILYKADFRNILARNGEKHAWWNGAGNLAKVA